MKICSQSRLAIILAAFLIALFIALTLGCGSSNAAKTSSTTTQTTSTPSTPSTPSSPPSNSPSAPSTTASAPTIQFSANPASTTGGQSTLTWSTTNATSVSIQPGNLTLAASGSVAVTPSTTTTYTATATGAGGTVTATATVTVTPPAASGYAFGHVVIVALENKDYAEVVGNNAAMPYLNSLITKYGLATNFYANTHPSIGNYLMLTTGQIITNDDSFSGTVSVDNVVRELNAAGKSWRAYAEDLPSAGYTGGDSGAYIERHNPLSYFSDVRNDAAMATAGIVPFTQFATDLAAGKLPQYTFITPNMYNDAHECPNGIDACLAVADGWLQQNIAPLIADPNFAKDGVLIIWFDEADTDNTNGGGRIPVVFISPTWSKPGYQSTTFGQQESLLRFTMDALGVTIVPGAGATTTGWNEFFNAH